MRVPSEAEEAARNLVRAREDARGDLMRARHRLSKLLLRHGLVWESTAWTGAHEAWLRTLRFDRLAVQLAFDEAFDAVLTVHARRDRLDVAIAEMAATSEYAPVVARLCCVRGIGTLTGFGLAVEVGDWRRFTVNRPGSVGDGRLDARGKRPTISAVAVAREVASWTWSLAIMDG